VLGTDDARSPVTIEGEARRVLAPELLGAFNDTVNAKYETDYSVEFYDPATNGVWNVAPVKTFGLDGDDFSGSPTRWEFG
jgi:hypothetical protein